MVAAVENMFYVGETPWHKEGIPLENPPTSEEAIKKAGLDWEVKLEKMEIPKTETSPAILIPGRRAVVRQSDLSILGTVGTGWSPLQNKEAFEFFDPFIQKGFAQYETAGSLRDGKIIWILAKGKGDPIDIVKNDPIERYFLLSNAHTGKKAVNVGFTPIRVVCQNTLNAALGSGAKSFLKVLHRGSVIETLSEIQESIDFANQTFELSAENYRFLASKQVQNIDEFIVKSLKPKLTELALSDDDIAENIPRAHAQIIGLFEGGKGQDNPKVRGTYWAAYNAVTEWVDYYRGNDSMRLEKAWFGKGNKIKENALQVATTMAS